MGRESLLGRHGPWLFVAIAGGAAVAASCDAVLDIREFPALREDAGGDGAAAMDGTVGVDATAPDASADAASEAAPDGADGGELDATPAEGGGACGAWGKPCCSGTCDDILSCQSAICCGGGESVCGGGCSNTQTDTNNCGGCGAQCAGTCSAARCVVTIASGQQHPLGIAVDSTSIYWTNSTGGTVVKAPLEGVPDGGSPIVLASGSTTSASSPAGLALDATSVYWTDSGGTVRRVALDGGTTITLASGQSGPAAIVVDVTRYRAP